MSIPDIVNGCFELSGGYFVGLSIFKLHREKIVRGVAWQGVAFFSTWGLWNLYFYPSLGQLFSFIGGLSIATANAIWLGMLIYYSWMEGRR